MLENAAAIRRRRTLTGCTVFLCAIVATTLIGGSLAAPNSAGRWTLAALAACYLLYMLGVIYMIIRKEVAHGL